MFTKLIVKNFKSIGAKGIDLELKPLTVLVGPNGSGKTTILESIALLAQSVKRELNLSGKFVIFPSFTEMAHKGELERSISWEMHFSGENLVGFKRQFQPDTGESSEIVFAEGKPILTSIMVGDKREGYTMFLEDPATHDKFDCGHPDSHSVLHPSRYRASDWPAKKEDSEKAATIADWISEKLETGVFLISALRGDVNPEIDSTQQATWVGKSGENLLTLLSISESPRYQVVKGKVNYWAERFELGSLWAGRTTTPGKISSLFKDDELNTAVNLAYAGMGSRQVLSIIFQLFWAKPGSLIMIEEPEMSLHPEAQVKLGELFADAIKENKQIIVSTHSHFLLLALGQAVEKGLQVRDIAVYHVTKGREGTKAAPVKLGKQGYPLGWPPSYEKVEREVAFNWAKGLAEE